MAEFEKIKIRVSAIIRCENEIALILRHKNGQDTYTLPGGNVEDGEDIFQALQRELDEEMNIHSENPKLLAIQDQMVSRPGATPSPRKLHFIFGISINADRRSSLATSEIDDLGEGHIVWVDMNKAASFHLYPAIGPMLEKYSNHSSFADWATELLPAMTNENFQWR